jgi:hypothetical protein
MIKLKHGNVTRVMTERTYLALKHQLKGWVVVKDTPVATEKPIVKQEPSLTKDEMVEYLKSKGVKVHWNLSDEKIKERYDSETKIN